MSKDPRYFSNALRVLSMDAVQAANSGHPGMPMGMADIADVLWTKHLRHSPTDPSWCNRDRFILSNGHGCMLQYALLHFSGYDLPMEQIKQFRQLGSKTPGHPEKADTPGVETTTGPLGQGIANAVGMALAEKMLAVEFNKPNFNLVDHHTYVFAGDGDLMEGVSHEVCSLAGTWSLGKLILIWDDNGISIDGKIANWFTTDVPQRFRSYGWHVIEKVDGHDHHAMDLALQQAREHSDAPTLICAKTVIGFGSPNKADTAGVHGSPLGEEEIKAARAELNWTHDAFEMPDDIYQHFDAKQKGLDQQLLWNDVFVKYESAHPVQAAEFLRRTQGFLPEDFADNMQAYLHDCVKQSSALATRKASAQVIAQFAKWLPEICGGSADLTGSNGTAWPEMKWLQPHEADGFNANYISYGVREFGMSAIMNGMTLHGGFKMFGGTFLSFNDYARPAVRLSALMRLGVIYIYSHDSIGLGEDGPTHQPIEQLSSLRLMPHLDVWRPADLLESAVSWQSALTANNPSALILTRQTTAKLEHTVEQIEQVQKGAYVVYGDQAQSADIILFATGSEVGSAIEVAKTLAAQSINARVVSMPCWKVFFRQDKAYQEMILDYAIERRVAIEAGASDMWYRVVGHDGLVCGIDDFGHSAPYEKVYEAFGLMPEQISKRILNTFSFETTSV